MLKWNHKPLGGDIPCTDILFLAYDGSDHAKKAAQRAAEIGAATGAQVTIITTYPSLSTIFFLDAEISKEDMKNYWTEKATEINGIFEEKGIAFNTVVEEGEPREIILDKAGELGADLIIVGSRGLNRYQRLMLGAVSQAITTHAKCDVLVVK